MNAALPNWDVIAFDCDGVLLDSNGMKSAAFRATLASAGVAADTAEAFCEHQVRHFGTSRHRLFTDLLAGRFGACPDGLTLEALLQAFGQASRDGYRRVTPTRGAEALLQALSGRMLYVASGSDERELRQEFDARGWSPHFRAVLGSPRPKTELLDEVVRQTPGARRRLMVGDAQADLAAAQANGFDFLFVADYSTVRDAMLGRAQVEGFACVDTLQDLLS